MGMQIPCGVHPEVSAQALYGSLRKHLGGQFRELARHKECEIGEGHLMVDHVHMLVSIPPKYSVSQVIGYMKGKSAIHIARTYGGKRRNFVGQHFWARGYWVSTVGHNEAAVRLYYPRAREGRPTPGSVGTVRRRKPL
jgi:putative transposase